MRRKNLISICLVLCLLCVSGCGDSSASDVPERIVELREPHGKRVGTETVIRRDMYDAAVFEAAVYPLEEEYAYEVRQTFGSYGPLPGESIESGEVLLYVDQESILKRIESLEERLQSMTESFEEYRAQANETLAGDYWFRDYYQKILDNLEQQKPEQYITDANGQQTVNPKYTSWAKEWKRWDGEYNANELDIATGEEALRQKREIYELDYDYYYDQLQEVKAQQADGILTAKSDGEVIGVRTFEPEEGISSETTVVVVGDMDQKVMKCQHELTSLRSARQIYAFINGKRYELTNIDTEITNTQKGTAISEFLIHDEDNEISVGDYGAIVMVKNIREQVLAVPYDTIHIDATGRYIYLVKNGEAVATPVKVGMSDGIYAEILSGVEEGDQILVSEEKVAGDMTAVLTPGSLSTEFARTGELYFPKTAYVTNPVEYATVFFQEYTVTVNQYVEEGDVIATVRVVGDEIALAQKENELKRAKERLADLIAENDEANEAAIEKRQESVAALEEEVAKMRADFATTEIRATQAGIVLELKEYVAEDIVKTGAKLLLIADDSIGYLQVLDTKNVLNYNNILTITYTDKSKQKQTTEGRTVTLGEFGAELEDSKNKLIELDKSVLENILPVYLDASGRYRKNQMAVVGVGKVLNNVLIVPKEAVTAKNGATYVDVLNEDGTVTTVSFLAGGMVSQYYWVVEGLTEGMTICWE